MVPRTDRLPGLAAEALGDPDQDVTLYRLNAGRLVLPAGTHLSLPPRNAPAVGIFALLVAILTAVGVGWGLHTPPLSATIESRAGPQPLP